MLKRLGEDNTLRMRLQIEIIKLQFDKQQQQRFGLRYCLD